MKQGFALFVLINFVFITFCGAHPIPDRDHILPADILRVTNQGNGFVYQRCRFDGANCKTIGNLSPSHLRQIRNHLGSLNYQDLPYTPFKPNDKKETGWKVNVYPAIGTGLVATATALGFLVSEKVGMATAWMALAGVVGYGVISAAEEVGKLKEETVTSFRVALLSAFDLVTQEIQTLPVGASKIIAVPEWLWLQLETETPPIQQAQK